MSSVCCAPSINSAIAVVIGRNLPGALCSTTAGTAPAPGSSTGNKLVKCRRRERAAQPPEAGEEHERELIDHRPGDAYEQIVEAPVAEVVLDPGAADPAGAAVDDRHLAMVEVAERVQVPARRATGAERAECSADLASPAPRTRRRRPSVSRSYSSREPCVGGAALLVDDDAHVDAFGRLARQHLGELVADGTRLEAELVDVDRRLGGLDVGEHPWIERGAGDEQLRR